MKKLFFLGLLMAFLSTKSQDTISTNCESPEGSTLLGYQELMNTIKNYHNNNYDKLEEHTKVFYISSSAILFLDSFFKNSNFKDYYAFCLYFMNYNATMNPHQRKRTQSFLYLTPVYDDPATVKEDSMTKYKALKDFYETVKTEFSRQALNNTIPCYGTCDSSLNYYLTWGPNDPKITYVRLRADINDRPNNEIFMLTSGRSGHDPRRRNYETGQGRELSNRQTKRVYFKKEVVCRLASFIKSGDNLKNFPMIGIYFGSYNDLKVPEQSHPNQTIVSFVPMWKTHDGYLEPDICSYIKYYKKRVDEGDKCFIQYNADKALNKKFSENHGTLCPTKCPTGGDNP